MLLNHLLVRFEMNEVHDFYGFFAEPWAYAIYHKNFSNAMDTIDQLFKASKTNDGKSLVAKITEKLEENEWNLVRFAFRDEDLKKVSIVFSFSYQQSN